MVIVLEPTQFVFSKANANLGDVVRIAPNELVFLAPEAARGEFFSHRSQRYYSPTKIS